MCAHRFRTARRIRAISRRTVRHRIIGTVSLHSIVRASEHSGGKPFAELSGDDRIALLKAVDKGELKLDGVDGKAFFTQLVKDVQMGFFADPIYGGNRDMVAWKMIGYPGARYNYLDWVNRHNERFPLPPVGMTGNAQWTRLVACPEGFPGKTSSSSVSAGPARSWLMS